MEILGREAVKILTILVLIMAAVIAVLLYRLNLQKKQIQKMKRQGLEKNNYLTNMSHEIRTPLNGIIGLEYLMREHVNHPDRMVAYLDKLKVSSQFLKNLVADVLDLSKIENGQLEIDMRPLDLREVLRVVQGMIQIQAEEAHISFKVKTELSEPYIVGDEVRLKQILVNLLGNAIKFTDRGGWVQLETGQSKISGDRVKTCFIISDNGCGMSEAFLDRIWEPFEQEGETPRRSGNGLGTTLCKSLTEQMGGAISVESRRGQGTRFTVSIPGERASKEEDMMFPKQENPAYKQQREADRLSDMLVLVADDNDINREIACEILHSKGCRTIEAVNGREAVAIFADSAPRSISRILMDIRMPVMDGYEAARIIRQMPREDASDVKIVALTANAFKDELERVQNAGMDGVITKPVDVEQLLAVLR